jgi:hypothetical protein
MTPRELTRPPRVCHPPSTSTFLKTDADTMRTLTRTGTRCLQMRKNKTGNEITTINTLIIQCIVPLEELSERYKFMNVENIVNSDY